MFEIFKSNCLNCNVELSSLEPHKIKKYCNDSCRHKHKRALKKPPKIKKAKPVLDWGIITPPMKAFGFIYKVTQLSTLKIYIGKKNFYFNGLESNWKTYLTSSKELKMSINENPLDFKAEIIDYGYSARQLTWKELQYQEEYNVFGGDDSFNKKSQPYKGRKNNI